MPAGIHLDPEYQKKYRARPEMVAQNKQHKLNLKAKKRRILNEAIGDCCAFCSSQERLELDHINPALGRGAANGHRGINTPLWHINEQLEINNLRWLCYTCHRDHSRRQQDAAWRAYISLPLDEQERWMIQ